MTVATCASARQGAVQWFDWAHQRFVDVQVVVKEAVVEVLPPAGGRGGANVAPSPALCTPIRTDQISRFYSSLDEILGAGPRKAVDPAARTHCFAIESHGSSGRVPRLRCRCVECCALAVSAAPPSNAPALNVFRVDTAEALAAWVTRCLGLYQIAGAQATQELFADRRRCRCVAHLKQMLATGVFGLEQQQQQQQQARPAKDSNKHGSSGHAGAPRRFGSPPGSVASTAAANTSNTNSNNNNASVRRHGATASPQRMGPTRSASTCTVPSPTPSPNLVPLQNPVAQGGGSGSAGGKGGAGGVRDRGPTRTHRTASLSAHTSTRLQVPSSTWSTSFGASPALTHAHPPSSRRGAPARGGAGKQYARSMSPVATHHHLSNSHAPQHQHSHRDHSASRLSGSHRLHHRHPGAAVERSHTQTSARKVPSTLSAGGGGGAAFTRLPSWRRGSRPVPQHDPAHGDAATTAKVAVTRQHTHLFSSAPAFRGGGGGHFHHASKPSGSGNANGGIHTARKQRAAGGLSKLHDQQQQQQVHPKDPAARSRTLSPPRPLSPGSGGARGGKRTGRGGEQQRLPSHRDKEKEKDKDKEKEKEKERDASPDSGAAVRVPKPRQQIPPPPPLAEVHRRAAAAATRGKKSGSSGVCARGSARSASGRRRGESKSRAQKEEERGGVDSPGQQLPPPPPAGPGHVALSICLDAEGDAVGHEGGGAKAATIGDSPQGTASRGDDAGVWVTTGGGVAVNGTHARVDGECVVDAVAAAAPTAYRMEGSVERVDLSGISPIADGCAIPPQQCSPPPSAPDGGQRVPVPSMLSPPALAPKTMHEATTARIDQYIKANLSYDKQDNMFELDNQLELLMGEADQLFFAEGRMNDSTASIDYTPMRTVGCGETSF